MAMPILLYAVTAALYGLLALYFWRTRWCKAAQADTTQTDTTTVAARTAATRGWEHAAILAPLLLHALLLYQVLFGAPELRFGFGLALSIILWLAVLIYWLERHFLNLEGMQPVLLATAAVCSFLPLPFPGLLSPAYAHALEFRLHLALGMLAYSLFTIAALQAFLMTLLERRLRGRTVAGPLASLSPLLTMESVLFKLIAMGFFLLTLTLVTGAIFSETIFQQAMKFSHKTLFAVLSWLIFAALLAGRHFYGWRGRKALRWTLSGFSALLLAYVGSRFVLEVILSRTLS
ncbi:MAG: cytochrome c biogenesis protein CcsA [Betaproteobacteria bacterium]